MSRAEATFPGCRVNFRGTYRASAHRECKPSITFDEGSTISRGRNVPRYPTPCFRSLSIFSCYGRGCLSFAVPNFSFLFIAFWFFYSRASMMTEYCIRWIVVNVTNIRRCEQYCHVKKKKNALDKTSCRSYLFAISINCMTIKSEAFMSIVTRRVRD